MRRLCTLLFLRWLLRSEEAYIRTLRRERILTRAQIRSFEAHAEALRVRIALLDGDNGSLTAGI